MLYLFPLILLLTDQPIHDIVYKVGDVLEYGLNEATVSKAKVIKIHPKCKYVASVALDSAPTVPYPLMCIHTVSSPVRLFLNLQQRKEPQHSHFEILSPRFSPL